MKNADFKSSFITSVIAHIVAIFLLYFGVPSLWKKFPEDQVMTFEMLPISSVTNIKTQKAQKDKAVDSENAKEVKSSQPEEVKEEKSPEKPEPKTPEIQHPDQPKEDLKPKEPEKKEPKPAETKPQPKPKEEVKKKPSPKKKEVNLDSLLKTLEKASEGTEAKSKKEARSDRNDVEHDSKGPYNEGNPLSISEQHAIKQQIERHWNVPIGAKNASDVKITLYIALKPTGEVMQAKLLEKRCPGVDAITCDAAADSALRAVYSASPFENLDPSRYNAWKEFNMEFDPSNI
ncbi:MAG: energy transducer TonB [Rickettsiaceae bacterium]|nr:energy transducer TonB [Rickettsiaceae bacterium]